MSGEGKRPHYGLLDTVRGVCILSMVAYHGMYDLVDIFGLPSAWYTGLPGYIWQQSICWTFILLSGMCWQLSRRHVKRGLLLVGCGAAITAVTWLVMPSQRILYGVLNLLGLSALLLIPLDKVFRKIPAWAGLGGALLLFALTKNVSRGSLGFEGLVLCRLPSWLYATDSFGGGGVPLPQLLEHGLLPPAALVFPVLRGVLFVEPAGQEPPGQGAAAARPAPPKLFGAAQPCHLPYPPARADGGVHRPGADSGLTEPKKACGRGGCKPFLLGGGQRSSWAVTLRLMAHKIPLTEAMLMLWSMPTPKTVSPLWRSWM